MPGAGIVQAEIMGYERRVAALCMREVMVVFWNEIDQQNQNNCIY